MTSFNLGLNVNNGISRDSAINVSNQTRSNDLFFESNSGSAAQNINTSPLASTFKIDTSHLVITSFIAGDKSKSIIKNNADIDLAITLENDKNRVLTKEIVDNVKSYKLNLCKNMYQKLENKVDMLLSVNNNSEKYINKFFKDIASFERLSSLLERGIVDKTIKIKANNFESIFKKFVLEEESSTQYFSVVTTNFLNNFSKERTSKKIGEFKKVLESEQPEMSLSHDFLTKEFIENHNLISLHESKENEFSKEIRTTINDMTVQNLVTMIRNLYFMSPNTLFENYKRINCRRFLDFESNSLKVLTSESNRLQIFENINTNNNTFLFENVVSSIDLKQKNESELKRTRNAIIVSSIRSLEGVQYLPYALSSYIDQTMINNFKQNLHLKTHDTISRSLFEPHAVSLSKEINNVYLGKFFNIDLAKFDIIKDYGIRDILAQALFGSQNRAVTKFHENYFQNADREVIYKYNSPITKYENRSAGQDSTGVIKASDTFNIDDPSVLYINDLEYKMKLDSLVKRNKIKRLKNKKVDFTYIEQTIDSIKNSSLTNDMLAYCFNDKEKISILDKDNKLFDLLFTTSEEDEVYSHIDLLTNHSIDNKIFRGAASMKKNEVSVNSNYEETKNSLKSLIANYYPESSFFSSTSLYKKIIKSIINEASIVEDAEYEEASLTQSLYFNFFKDNVSSKTDIKSLVAKRFIKKAIQTDKTVSGSTFKNTKIKSFKYDVENILEDDFDKSSKSEMKSYLDKILDSSLSLKTIKNNVFGSKNIYSLKLLSDFKRVSNVKFSVSGYDSDANVNTYNLSAVINYNLVPNYCLLYNFSSSGDFKEEANIVYHIEKRNKFIVDTVYGGLDASTGQRAIVSQKYNIDNAIKDFDVTSSEDIVVKITPKLCKSDAIREENEFPSIVITDMFDKIFMSENCKSFVFGSVTDTIQDMLRLSIKDYDNLMFHSEEDIDSLITNNSSIVDDVIDLIELFSNLYLIYTSRMQRLQAMSIFKWQKKHIEHGIPGRGSNSSFSYNGIISKHSNVYNSFKDAMGLSDENNIGIISKSLAVDSLRDFVELHDILKNSSQVLLNSRPIETSADDFKTHITDTLYNIARSLFVSDISQSFTFDVINGFLDHQEKIILSDANEISDSASFDMIDNMSEEAIESIEENFYNMFYINNLSKKMLYMKLKNTLNYDYIQSSFEHKSFEYYVNKNMFEKSRVQKEQSIMSVLKNIDNNKSLSKEVFLGDHYKYLNSNFSSFGLKQSALSNSSIDSIIKITVNIVDKFNVNRFYLPKVFLFSPMITNVDYFSKELLSQTVNNSNNSFSIMGLFNPNKNIDNRLSIVSIEEMLNNSDSFLVNVIKSKFNITSDEAFNVYKHLINCHSSSNEISRIMKHIYSINRERNFYKNEVSKEIYSLADNLTEKQFFNIFDSSKSKTLASITESEDESYKSIDASAVINNNNIVYKTLSKLENLSSMKEIEKGLEDIYYDIFSIAINTESFYYVDTSDSAVRSDENEYITSDVDSIFHKVLNVSDFMIGKTCKKSNLAVDNFSIVFNTEII